MGELYEMLKARRMGGGGSSPTLITKSITQNGTYSASDDSADGYSEVSVDVANSYTAQDEGKVVSSGQLVAQTSTTATANGTINTTTNNEVVVNVPNSYTASDEGKVVSGGSLVAQTAYPSTITDNGTYDTTENNSVTVDVPSTTNSGIAYPPGSTTGYIIVSIFGTQLYVSTKLSATSSSNQTATFQSPFQLSDFIDTDLSLTLEGFRNSSASTYEMNVTLKPSTNQIVYRTDQSLGVRSLFSGSARI